MEKGLGYILRGFGIANILNVIAGLYYSIAVLFAIHTTYVFNSQEPYFLQASLIMIGFNIIFLVGLFITGIYLFKKNPRAVIFCNIIFVSELIYFLCIVAITTGFAMYGDALLLASISKAFGISNVGIVLHIMTGYSIVALIALNIARYRYKKFENRLQIST